MHWTLLRCGVFRTTRCGADAEPLGFRLTASALPENSGRCAGLSTKPSERPYGWLAAETRAELELL